MPDHIRVSVVFAVPERVFLRELELPDGANVDDAIEASGLRRIWPRLLIGDGHVGIFARTTSLNTLLRDGDRVEVYRPLKIDPKEARRKRARKP